MKILSTIFMLLFAAHAYAADIYLDVDATSCTGGGASDSNYDPATRACGAGSSTVYAGNYPFEASQGLSNNDTFYLRAGTYYENVTGEVGYTYAWGALHVTVDGVTITNYNGEEVHLQGGSSGTSVVAHTNNAADISGTGNTLIGTGRKFFIYGCVIVSGTTTTLNGLDMSGGWDHQSAIGGDAWYDMVRFINATNAVVKNSWIHDPYDHGTNTNAANKAAMMHEGDNNTIVENNNFYNLLYNVAYCKYQSASGTVHATYRKNFFDGYGMIQGSNTDNGKEIHVYQNVCVNAKLFGFSEGISIDSGIKIYNNTVWGASAGLINSYTGNVPAFAAWNNIVYLTGSNDIISLDNATVPGTGWYFDYNNYYGSATYRWTDASHSFAQWQTFLTGEANSITTDPGFNPVDGNLDGDGPDDFKRSSYTANGRGGAYESVMGAYTNSGITIGVPSSNTGSAVGGGTGRATGGGTGSMSAN